MKKVLLSAVALTAIALGGCSSAKNGSHAGKSGYSGLAECQNKCAKEGMRVDFQYSELEGACRCSQDLRDVSV
jgi:hypothetical protein